MDVIDEVIGACEAEEEIELSGGFITGNGRLSITEANFDGRLPRSEMPTSIVVSRIGGTNPVSEKYSHDYRPTDLSNALADKHRLAEELKKTSSLLFTSRAEAKRLIDYVDRQSIYIADLQYQLDKARKPSLFSRLKRLLRIGK